MHPEMLPLPPLPMEKSPPQPPAVTPSATEPGRRKMRQGIIVLMLSQFLPFYQGSASLEQRYTGGRGTYQNAYVDKGYGTFVKSGRIYSGFESHPYALLILPMLFAMFFTRLYYRPGWSAKIYWAAIILAIGCTELPPPIGTLGGFAAAVALALMGYSIYQRSQIPKTAAPAV